MIHVLRAGWTSALAGPALVATRLLSEDDLNTLDAGCAEGFLHLRVGTRFACYGVGTLQRAVGGNHHVVPGVRSRLGHSGRRCNLGTVAGPCPVRAQTLPRAVGSFRNLDVSEQRG